MSVADPGGGRVARLRGVSLRYGAVTALDAIDIDIPAGCMVGFIGPDGVGKSSLLSLVAGARQIQEGTVEVLGGDMADAVFRRDVCPRVAFMPQGLGKNLYPDLSVEENIAFFARLFGQDGRERRRRIADLTRATGLAPFLDRPAKKLSGGMRQKLGLCCALVHDPDLLILDEPTTGVDPLSRRQFWELIQRMRGERPGMSVLVATAYMDEAEAFDWLIAMDAGRVLATGTPAELKIRTGAGTLEEAFVALLPEDQRGEGKLVIPPRPADGAEPVIVARDLTCRFGDFTAVDQVSFTIERGEIFGFLGSNGCGKTTTMKMLTGLLPPTSGSAWLFGQAVDGTDQDARRRVGYMSQSFSLYAELTVQQNLDLHARLFHIPWDKARARVADLIEGFDLGRYRNQQAADLPLGIRQRLSLAVALVHEPQLLILDEPSSGVDPIARDEFWKQLVDLSRNHGVTIFVSTHFMNEAQRCDRISFMHAGRVLETGTPEELTRRAGVKRLEDAFIACLEAAQAEAPPPSDAEIGAAMAAGAAEAAPRALWPGGRRLFAYAMRESLELLRDRIRLGFALFGTAFLMLVFGFGITTDVDSLTFAALDRDNSIESRAFLEGLRGSRYFTERPPIADEATLERRMQSGEITTAIEIPPNFGRDLKAGRSPTIAVWIDGAMPFRAETIRGYVLAAHQQYLAQLRLKGDAAQTSASPLTIETRFRYNQNFDSIYAMVPSVMALVLMLIPAILMALAVVREKELGSITNLYVTPVTRLEFLLGKQLPYIAIAMANFALLFFMAIVIFQVPLKGSFLVLVLGALLFVTTSTGFGMLVSSFTSTQIAALFGTTILTVLPATQFSGMLTPVSSLSGTGAIIGQIFPMTYFLRISVGTFTKSLGFAQLGGDLLALAVIIPVLTVLSMLFLRKQER